MFPFFVSVRIFLYEFYELDYVRKARKRRSLLYEFCSNCKSEYCISIW